MARQSTLDPGTEAPTESEPTEPEPTAEAATPTKRAMSPRPDYGVGEAVDDLPEDVAVRRGPSDVYLKLLKEVAASDTPYKWHPIATFHTTTGGKAAITAINKGERKIPNDNGETWEFRSVRITDPANPEKSASRLYARLVG